MATLKLKLAVHGFEGFGGLEGFRGFRGFKNIHSKTTKLGQARSPELINRIAEYSESRAFNRKS